MNESDNKKFIPYGHQWIDDSDIKEVVAVLKSDWLTQGPKVKEFEEALADYCEASYAVVFSSGTAALHAAYFSIGLEKNDEIITSPNTFVATSNAAIFLGAKPVFVDIELDNGNINPDLIKDKITRNTKAIIPVHYSGHPVNLEKIHDIAEKHNLITVEDATHAIGAKYKKKKVGGLSTLTIFSFHPVKLITTGEGGAVLTNDRDLFERLVMFRTHGITKNRDKFINLNEGSWYYEMQYLGNNYRMTDIQAALGISQLKKLNKFIERRREIVNIYREAFGTNPYFEIPEEKEYAYSSWHLYPIRLKDRYKNIKRKVFSEMRKRGLGIQVHYIPVYWQPYYRKLGYDGEICTNAEDFYQREISLPLYPSMNNEDIKYVIDTIFGVFKEFE